MRSKVKGFLMKPQESKKEYQLGIMVGYLNCQKCGS